MHKSFLIKITVLTAIMAALLCLSSCSAEEIHFSLDMDAQQLTISVSSAKLSEDAQEKLSVYDDISLIVGSPQTKIVIDLANQDGTSSTQNTIMNAVAQVLPEYNDYLNGLSLLVEKDFFGTSLFGSEYFSATINAPKDIIIPLDIIFSKDFMFDGKQAKLDNITDKFVLSTNLNVQTGENRFEMQYHSSDYKSIAIEIDITDDSPIVLYHVVYDQRDADQIKNQLTSIGMTVEFCDSSRATFSEQFETCNDFQYMFPIRTFTLFDAITTVDYQFSSYFSDKCSVSFIFKDMNSENITLTIKSQENTAFMLIQDGEQTNSEGTELDINLYGDVEIRAEYSNARWFFSTTSILAIVVIVLVLFGLIYLVKKKF